MQRRTLVVAVLGLILGSSCASFSDPAVRLSSCLARAAGSLEELQDENLTVACDFRLQGPCVVVLHPAGQLSDAAYERAGLGNVTTQLQSLRLGTHEAIYVIPLEGQASASRTTAQGRTVSIPQLLAKTCSDSTVTITLRRTEQGIELVALE